MKIRCESAFTIMEVLVALALFSIAAIAMARAFASNMRLNTEADIRSGAVEAAQRVLDDLRVIDPSTLPTSGQVNSTVQIGDRTYSAAVTYCKTSTYCSSTTIRDVYVAITFNSKKYYEAESVYTQLR